NIRFRQLDAKYPERANLSYAHQSGICSESILSGRRPSMNDGEVLKHIRELTTEEERLYTKGDLSDKEVHRLHQMKVELDQCWDLLRQRVGLRDAGKNPNDATLRPPDVVENYEQ